ncbi:MAG: protein kinase [Gemmataceae bacterium]
MTPLAGQTTIEAAPEAEPTMPSNSLPAESAAAETCDPRTLAQPVGGDTSRQMPTLPAGTPSVIGGYTILGILGRGGMGVVYKAYDDELKRTVAIKMLWAGPDASTDDLVRFRGEAEIIARLQHPNIVQIYDIGQHDGHPFLALEYVEGGGLDRFVQGQPQPPRRAAEIVETLARAIHVAHALQIIHRDLKPANVLVAPNDQFKITDFGLAKRLGDSAGFTRTGDVMGTPSYMAPEQASGRVKEFGPTVDVYALGAILYELLTGRPPFKGASVPETLELVRNEEPASPSRLQPKLHRDLCTICLKCLHKSPSRRYATAEALASDLRRWLDGDPIEARPVSTVERLWVGVKRRPATAALGIGSVGCAVALALYATTAAGERHQAELAAQERTLRRDEQALRKELEGQFKSSLRTLDAVCNEVQKGAALSGPNGLKPLHDTLLTYYSELVDNQSAMRWSQRDLLADACLRLGDLLGKTGNKDRAIVAFEKARGIYGDLALGPDAKPEYRVNLARTHLECGKQFRDLGDAAKARAEYDAARAGFAALTTESPDRPEYRMYLAEVWHQLGVLLGDDAATKTEALDAYAKGRELRKALCDEFPTADEYRRDLARSHGYIGDVELDLGQLAAADASYWESHRLREQLAKQPEDRMQLGRSWGNFGNYQARVRAYSTALDFLEKSRHVQQDLVKEAPSFTEYQSDLAGTLCRIAELKLLQQKPADAAGPLQEAFNRYATLQAIDPKNAGVRLGLVECHVLRALAALATNRAAAGPELDAARPLVEELCKQRGTAVDFYYRAALAALDAERPALAAKERRELHDRANDALKQAIQKGYRRKHPDDLRRDRAFQSLRDTEGFAEVLRAYDATTRPKGD